MVSIDTQSLMARLNPLCRQTLEWALGATLSRTNYNVEIEHWLGRLFETAESDVSIIARSYEIDVACLLADLTRVLDRLKTGNARSPKLSPDVVKMVREAWLLASLVYGDAKIRSGHLLLALLSDEALAPLARESSDQFHRIAAETLRKDLKAIVADGVESPSPAEGSSGTAAPPRAVSGQTSNLDQYCIDFTQRAKEGRIDPVLGRDAEIRQVIDILTRRRQNNPILTGEAGVGKTAVVEGFAIRIATGDVPDALKNVRLLSLDLGLLQAGAGVKGEFENRLKGVIEEVGASSVPIIVFIDEAHTLIGAGGQAGQNDAANLLKPALARGEMRTIAATTWAEYKKYFERDAALTRRFQVVKVEEPSETVAVDMLRGLCQILERHHGVRVLTEALEEAVRLSQRYIPARQLPDKAVSLLDTACARVAMSQKSVPPAIEDLRRKQGLLDTEISILQREQVTGIDHNERLTTLARERDDNAAALSSLEARWSAESELVARMSAVLANMETAIDAPEGEDGTAADDIPAMRKELAALDDELSRLQGEKPLVKARVDGQAVADVVANWTGIPVGRMVSDEIRTVLSLKTRLGERIIGQDHALEAISQAMWISRARMTDPRKPIGVFLMVGTSGTGKTETALALADLLYGGEQNITVINMSEFKEEHKVSMLVGSPPGYVGFGEGGVLTEAVRRRPYSVLLLDEMEKAHPGVHDVFFQVFDKGMLRDGEGRDIDFKNTLIIMTSNAGTELIHALFADPAAAPDADGLGQALRPELLKVFKPAFLGRCVVVPYFPLAPDIVRKIVNLQIAKIARRLADNYRAVFTASPDLVDTVTARCQETESGARNIETILNRKLLPELSVRLLARLSDGDPVTRVHVSVDDAGGFVYDIA